MDAKLALNLEELESLFTTKMAAYEAKLASATAGSSSSAASTPVASLTSLSQEFSDFKSFVMQALSKFKTQLELLSQGFDRHETIMRRKVLLIHGVPEAKDEKVPDVVSQVFHDSLKLNELSRENIHVCHRLGSGKRSRPILVRFFTTEHRQLVWDAKKSLKGTGYTISEFLTRMRHQTFVAARKHFGMSNCWSSEGKILIITPDKSRHKLESMDELQKLLSKYPLSNDVLAQPAVPTSPQPAPLSSEPATPVVNKLQRRLKRRN
ncbi:uncharacterized protein LOC113507450 [Trichoplusia ni]|uniref:Uncharacterized protein LOC113507450 n=1 Tax=Trichoplusia ni TaxID=7111 RepID=A0A7E5WZ05_TRINI|nr:uncharacterized protein LOC113507450 [Trichoplusia ni]